MVLQIARNLSQEIKLNYDAVNFDYRLRNCKHICVSLASDVILYTIGCLYGLDRETRDYLSSAYPPKVMRQFIQSVPVNIYSPTIKKLERVFQPRYRPVPLDTPRGLPRRLIELYKYRIKNLLNSDKLRILLNHESIESQRKRLTGRDSYIVQHAIEAWENREFNFGDMEFIMFSVIEKAVPFTFEDNIQTFLCREEVPYIETRVSRKLPTELPLLEVK